MQGVLVGWGFRILTILPKICVLCATPGTRLVRVWMVWESHGRASKSKELARFPWVSLRYSKRE